MGDQLPDSFLDDAFIVEISQAQVPLTAYVLKLCGNHHFAEDVLQETNVVLWKKRLDWDPATPFLKWAYRVAYFQTKAHFRDLQRDQKRLTFDNDLLDLLAEDEPQFHSMADLQDALNHCLGKMDTTKRTLLIRRYEGLDSVETIAAELEMSPNTLSQKLRRLRSRLAKCISTQVQQAV
ncbi:sigma-70 family RNA polymerase sigma factor [Coraliomargarita akajimensis]|uniref:RNA polymerase, sigma-24 subunit, ECF subfamily n=1 Tax=Coraliomargarita akajimensis (strain DSM 45221 / IAM 15411 / JCM 23193 / KCTC 12865 / 04OKA010-24) TaxID=583355 RepID=D5ENY3_CORAD|nr:sigma-70 family RNA polymerase sigma factor [Coraliomargarita akajimensis]ADE53642.1 RNA polymerase, sigma-24 subunit, ECF subfamily [Coraliomargarita akajimensis DSM 45221]